MIKLSGDCFNSLYLRALNIGVSAPRVFESSRVGPVINLGQAYLEINANDPRLIFLNHRKLNPVFAIVEGAWVLSGSNRLAPLENELPNIRAYSDDGKTLNGAYGARLRCTFGIDQISSAVDLLKKAPNTRRAVLTMYSPNDLIEDSKDIPCNTTAYLKIDNEKLNITVLNRSNDLYLGLPYNIFIFGLLQRHISRSLGVQAGKQSHFSDSLHIYKKDIINIQHIVSNNNQEEVRKISKKFDWDYSDAILENVETIVSGNYEAIKDDRLSSFLQQFCKKSRNQRENMRGPLKSSDSLLGFLAYQWLSSGDYNEQWEKQRRLMMYKGVKKDIEELSKSSGEEIAQGIMALAERLRGNFSSLKEAIEKRSGPFKLRDYNGDEDLALREILLCAVWTTLDPYLASTSIGTNAKQEIIAAANLLNVPFSDVGPLSTVEEELFSTLSKLLD
jgi:thymidylate synthase